MKRFVPNIKGFTLIELLIVIGIIGILAVATTVNYSKTSAQSRDAQRRSDLTNLQVAIEAYNIRFGRYPLGCNAAGSWSGQIGTSFACSDGSGQYIKDLAPDFISVLPTDPKLPSGRADAGYVYAVNAEGTVYKIMAMNTVEEDELIASNDYSAYTSPFKSCDMKASLNTNDGGKAQGYLYNQSLCHKVSSNGSDLSSGAPSQCTYTNDRFKSSYALWGGFAQLKTMGANISFPLPDDGSGWREIYKTAAIICK